MLTTKEGLEVLARLENGNGVFIAEPYFIKSDGSIIDKDGNEVYKASAYGAGIYSGFAGYGKNAAATATIRGGIKASAKGSGDTVEVKIGTDGKGYVPTYPYEMSGFVSVVDEVAAALPELPVEQADGYLLADQTTEKIYTLATVAEEQTWGSGVALVAGKLYTDGTDLYVYGSGSLAKI